MQMPADGEVHLWFLDLVQLGSPLQPEEPIEASRFTPRLQRTLRRFYLRLLLGAYLGMPGKDVRVRRQYKGKPALATSCQPGSFDFSMAASDGCCLIGFSTSGELGVDLEPGERRANSPLALALRYFSPAEADALERLEARQRDRAFLHAWACKEAVVKAVGHGIANYLNRFTVDVRPDAPPRVIAMDDDAAGAWRLRVCHPSTRHMAAVALRNRRLRLRCFSLEPPP